MRGITVVFASVAMLFGLGLAFWSYELNSALGTHAALLGVNAFLFAIALGVWRNSDDHTLKQVNQRLDDLRKIEAQHLQAYYDNNPSRGQYRQEQSPTGQYQRPPHQ